MQYCVSSGRCTVTANWPKTVPNLARRTPAGPYFPRRQSYPPAGVIAHSHGNWLSEGTQGWEALLSLGSLVGLNALTVSREEVNKNATAPKETELPSKKTTSATPPSTAVQKNATPSSQPALKNTKASFNSRTSRKVPRYNRGRSLSNKETSSDLDIDIDDVLATDWFKQTVSVNPEPDTVHTSSSVPDSSPSSPKSTNSNVGGSTGSHSAQNNDNDSVHSGGWSSSGNHHSSWYSPSSSHSSSHSSSSSWHGHVSSSDYGGSSGGYSSDSGSSSSDSGGGCD